MNELPLLPTMGVGSYAAPGWFVAVRGLMRKGELGPHDVAEALDDATRVAVADQIEAGLDILSDGELRRQRFVFEMYDNVEGLERIAPSRRLGVPGYDMAPAFIARGTIAAPRGFGVVDDFLALKRLAPERRLKVALPGPLTFALGVQTGEREPAQVMDEIIAMVRHELDALVTAGADYIQLDEPSFPSPSFGLTLEEGAAVVNQALAGLHGRLAVHICFIQS